MVIVIDALDECGGKENMAEFIKVVIKACQNSLFPFQVLLTGRIDGYTREVLAISEARSKMHTLALQDFDADIDIRKFFRSQLPIMYPLKSRFTPNVWPSHLELNTLVEMASGSFLLASTIIEFIKPPDVMLPTTSNLHNIFDRLYTQILQDSKVSRSQPFKRIISTIMLFKSPLSISSLQHLLQLEAVDILQALIDVRSILRIPGSDDEPVRALHPSLHDFMTNKSRSGDFFVDPPVGHFAIATDCLKLLTFSPDDIVFDGEGQVYACTNWCHHFCEGLMSREPDFLDSSLGRSLIDYLTTFLDKFFDCWVNTLILHFAMRATLDSLDSLLQALRVSVVFHIFWDFDQPPSRVCQSTHKQLDGTWKTFEDV